MNLTRSVMVIAVLLGGLVLCRSRLAAAESSSVITNTAIPPIRANDANGNPIRRAPTGHISNYDESKAGSYTLPDPLRLQSGEPVRDADTWFKRRRPEILKLYETEIYGRIPERAPKIKFEVTETDTNVLNGAAVCKELLGRIGDATNEVHVHLYLPANATAPVPVLLHLIFGFGAAPTTNAAAGPRFSETGPLPEILARGYGYATFRYTEIEGDSAPNATNFGQAYVLSERGASGQRRASPAPAIVRKQALAPGQAKPAPDEWGTISAWSWGASRVLDYFETDRGVDAKRVAVIGHSRLGKTAVWTGARDPRFALVFSSCAGEMGTALARRDWGETIDDMAVNFPWQFAGNFQKYSGHWNDMPVDAHMVIALVAPRPVFVTGGTQDQWADPHGEFLAEVAAGPVYRLLGKKDLGTSELPPVDTPLITGDLGFHYHTGGHTITGADWKAFLDFADRYLRPAK